MRTGLAEVAYSAVEYVVGSDRHREVGVPQRGDRVLISTLRLLSPLRGGRSVRVLADRCGQPPVRLWALGVVVNATPTDTEWLVELPGGRVLSFDQVESAAPNLAIVVLAGSAGPKLALQTPSRRSLHSTAASSAGL